MPEVREPANPVRFAGRTVATEIATRKLIAAMKISVDGEFGNPDGYAR